MSKKTAWQQRLKAAGAVIVGAIAGLALLWLLHGGLRAGMGYCGARTVDQLRTEARFIQVTAASVRESNERNVNI